MKQTRNEKGQLTNRKHQPPLEPSPQTSSPKQEQPGDKPRLGISLAVKVRRQLVHGLVLSHFAPVWWVANAEHRLHPARRVGYGAAVGEAVEGGFATVGALAGSANAAELEGWDGGMEEAAD